MGKFKYKDILTKEFLLRSDIAILPSSEIGRRLCIHTGVIDDYRRLYGIVSDLALSHREARIIRADVQFMDWEIGILVGTLLGDGNLVVNGQNQARFRVRHCDKQREYVELQYQIFSRFCTNDITTNYVEATGKAYHGFSTIWHPTLTELYNKMYSNGTKIITQEILDKLTIPGLVCWFYDDGSKLRPSYLLSTCSFSLEENQLIRQHLFKKFGIKTSILKKSNGQKYYWYLYFAKATIHILEKYLSDFYLPCFDYKLHKSVLRPSETKRETSWNFIG